MQVPVWSDINGQDDIQWYTAIKQANGTYKVTVEARNHKYHSGIYHVHAYLKQKMATWWEWLRPKQLFPFLRQVSVPVLSKILTILMATSMLLCPIFLRLQCDKGASSV